MEVINLDNFYLTARQHAKDPHNHGALDSFNGHAKVTGPCGDTMEFSLQQDKEGIVYHGRLRSVACQR